MPEANTTSELATQTYGVDPTVIRNLFEMLNFGSFGAFLEKIEPWWNIYSVIAILASLIFFVGFIYAKIRLNQLYEINYQNLLDSEAIWTNRHSAIDSKGARWNSIKQKIAENNPESWRIAIIEADILLDETLTSAGYSGQSLGEKLKSANTQSFRTVQDAWDAHKVRNDIAHVGSDFILTQRTANETMLKFERVFREFDDI